MTSLPQALTCVRPKLNLRHYIVQTLEKHGWNQTEAAKRLGIHRNTLLTKMDMLQIRPAASSESSPLKDLED